MERKWIPLIGKFTFDGDAVFFAPPPKGEHGPHLPVSIGNLLSDEYFGGGEISVRFSFSELTRTEWAPEESAGVMLYYDPTSQGFVSAQLGGNDFASIWTFVAGRWVRHAGAGLGSELEADRDYLLSVRVDGSRINIAVDEVNVLSANLPYPLPFGQAGLWFRGFYPIAANAFKVERAAPRAFVVMQFTTPYNELFEDVIKPVCKELDVIAKRADDTYGPGVIIQDIERQIVESNLIIADITPNNPNVYYEVGFAHALRKPTILIAEHPKQLPFDVSPFASSSTRTQSRARRKLKRGFEITFGPSRVLGYPCRERCPGS